MNEELNLIDLALKKIILEGLFHFFLGSSEKLEVTVPSSG